MKIIKILTNVKETIGFTITLSRADLEGQNCSHSCIISRLQHELKKAPSVETTEDDITDLFEPNEDKEDLAN